MDFSGIVKGLLPYAGSAVAISFAEWGSARYDEQSEFILKLSKNLIDTASTIVNEVLDDEEQKVMANKIINCATDAVVEIRKAKAQILAIVPEELRREKICTTSLAITKALILKHFGVTVDVMSEMLVKTAISAIINQLPPTNEVALP